MGATVIVEASARPTPAREPVKILIAALGGQGGGVLTEWIVHAARAEGAVAQASVARTLRQSR